MFVKRWCRDAREETRAHSVGEEAAAVSEPVIRRMGDMVLWNFSFEEIGKELGPIEVFGAPQQDVSGLSRVENLKHQSRERF